jgi:hypothetical protein
MFNTIKTFINKPDTFSKREQDIVENTLAVAMLAIAIILTISVVI